MCVVKSYHLIKPQFQFCGKTLLPPEKDKRLVAMLIMLLYHEISNTKTAHKLLFPKVLLNQNIAYNRRLDW